MSITGEFLGANLLSASSSLFQRVAFTLLSLGSALLLVQPCGGAPVGDNTGQLHTARYQHTATLLADGRVLVVGGLDKREGYDADRFYTNATAELYDPKSGTWAVTGSLHDARFQHTATLLPMARCSWQGETLLLTSLSQARNCTTLQPGLGCHWQSHQRALSAHRELARQWQSPVISGDNQNYTTFDSPELYDPATGTWTLTGPIKHSRFQHTSTLLPDGRIFIAGGSAFFSNWSPSVEIYDPVSETSTNVGDLNTDAINTRRPCSSMVRSS